MAGRAIAAAGLNLLHDGGGLDQRKTAAAVLLRDERREEPSLGQRRHEFAWIGALAIELAPILARETGAQRTHGRADLRKLVGGMFGLRRGHLLSASYLALWNDDLLSSPRKRGRHYYTAICPRPLLIATTSRSTTRARKL